LELKQKSGKDIFVGSRSLIIQLLNSNLIDEFQICIHPVIEGKGLPLFDQIKHKIDFKLVKTKSLTSGATVFYYERHLKKQRTTNMRFSNMVADGSTINCLQIQSVVRAGQTTLNLSS
jgi:dihydrofolate reductase